MSIFDWPFQPASSLSVAGWGFWISILGILLGVIGFGLTFWQLLKTRSIAQAARDESNRIRTVVLQQDAAQDVSRANYALDTTRKHFSHGAWEHGAESYDDFARSIVALKRIPQIDNIEGKSIDQAKVYVDNLCLRIDRDPKNSSGVIDGAKLKSVIRKHTALIDRIQAIVVEGAF